MNEEALNRLFILAENDGYKKSFEEFKVLMSSNGDAINTMYGLAKGDGYRKDINEFKTLVGFDQSLKKKEETLAPTGSDLEASGQPATGTPASESELTSQPSEPFISRLPSVGSMSSLPSELKDKVSETLPESGYQTPSDPVSLPAKGKSDPNAPKQPLDKSQYYLNQDEKKDYSLSDILSAKKAGMSVEEYTAKAGALPTTDELPSNEQREKFLKEKSEFRENYIKEAYIDEIVKTGVSREDAEKNLPKLALNNYIIDPEGEGITKDPVANLKDVDKDEVMAYRDKLIEQELSLYGKTLKDLTVAKYIEKNDGDVEVAQEKFFEGMNAVSELFLSDSEKQIKGLKEGVYRLENFENLPEEKRILLERGKAELQKFIDEGLIGSEDLFDYKTGQFVSGNTKDEQIIAFNNELKKKKSMYEKTDLGQLIKDRDDSYFKFEAFLNKALEENLDLPGLSGGEKIYWSKRFGLIGQDDGIAEAKFVKFNKAQAMQIIKSQADSPFNFSGMDAADSSISDSMKILNSEVLDPAITKRAEKLLATFMATNSQIALNEDRSSREKYMDFQKYTDELREFGGAAVEGPAALLDMMSGTGVPEGIIKGFKENMGGTSMSELDQSRRAIERLSSMGYDLTDDQKEVMEVTTAEKFSEAAGGMIPVMAELAATSMVTGGISNAFKIPKLLKAVAGGKKALEKGLKFSYNMGMQGLNYELAGQSFSSGVGEFLGESVGEGLIKALGSKNPLLNVLSKAIIGAGGETMAEYSGEFVERLVEDDDTFSQALDKTIGTAETAGEKLATTYFLSLMMSSTMGMTGVNAEWRKDIEDTRRDLESQAEDSELIRNVLDKTKGLESNLRVMAEAEKRIRERDGLEPDAEISEKDLMSEVSTIMNEGNKKINEVISSSISDVSKGEKSLAEAFDEVSKTTGADLIIEEQFGKLETEADKKAAMLLMAYNADAKTKSNPEFVNWYKATEKELSGLEKKSEIVEAALAVQEQDNINQQKQGSKKADIEKRRQEELSNYDEEGLNETYAVGSNQTVGEFINSKYDAELAALEQDNINQQKQTDDVQEQQAKDVEISTEEKEVQELDVEQRQEEVMIDSPFDEDGEIDYEAEAEVREIAKERDLGITRDRNLEVVARDKDGKIIGGAFTSYDNQSGEYTFDVVVSEDAEGKGVGSKLLDQVKDIPFEISDMNPNATIKVDVVNPNMQSMLERRGFEVTEKVDGQGRVIMSPVETNTTEESTVETTAKEKEVAKKYVEELDKTKASNPEAYWSVDSVTEEDAANGTVIDTEDGAAVVSKDGDIKGVFKKLTSKAKGVAQTILKKAVEAGGNKLDNFVTGAGGINLQKTYEKAGFRVASRTPFNEEYAPEGWTEKDGKPDVVAMVYDPNNELDIEEKSFEDYDEMIAHRDSYIKPTESSTKGSPKTESTATTISEPTVSTEETFEIADDVIPEATEGALSLLDAFGKKPKKSKVTPKKRKQVLDQVAKAEKALSKISPNTKIVVHETSKDYKSSGRNRNQNEGGVYEIDAEGNGTIHINLEAANERTVAHEVFHALLLSEGMGDKQAQAITNKMLDAVKKSASPELLVELEEFSKKYVLEDENGNPILDKNGNTIPDPVQSEESIAELFGILASEYDTLPRPTQNIIKRWLDKLAKLFGLKLFTDNEVVDMLNTVSRSVREGSVIEESDIDVIRRDPMLARDTRADFLGGIPVDELTDADLDQNQTRQWDREQKPLRRLQSNFSDAVSKLTFSYDKNSDRFDKLKKEGYITDGKSISDFDGKFFFFHQPDAAFSGQILKDGELLVEGKGGMYYPIKFHEDGYFWASTDRVAKKMADDLNKVMEQNGGKIYMALTSAPRSKLMSSTTMSNAVMDFFSSKSFDSNFNISEAQVKRSIVRAANNVKTVNGKKVGLNMSLSVKDSLSEIKSSVSEKLDPKKSSFKDRKSFVEDLVGEMSREINKKDISIEQFGKFFSEGIQNKYFKGVTKTGKVKVSKANMIQALSEMMTEPILKDDISRESGGQIYAVLEMEGKVKPVKSDKHESYPMAIQSAEDKKTTLHILSDRVDWGDVTEDFETNEIVKPERRKKIYPTSGVSTRGLKINTKSVRRRKQKPSDDRPSIEAVREKAKELGVSEKDTEIALKNMGYTNAEIRSTEAKSIADAKDKYNTSVKRGSSKEQALKSAVGDLKSTYWYENATDTEREAAVRELRKDLGVKEKKAPSVNKILGKPKPEKQTKTVNSLREEFWKMWNKSFRESKKDQDMKRQEISKAISDIISRMRNDAKVKSRKLNAIQKKINRTNLNNPVMVERLIRYINNVMEDVNYSAKLAEANKNRSSMKRMSKSKKRAANLRASADEFALIDPSMVSDIDEYLDRSREIVAGLSPTSITPDKIKVSDKFNSSDMDSYINSQLKSQRAKMREVLNEHFEEVTGISGDDMTISEMIKAIEESKDTGVTPEMLEPITKANVKKAYDSYSSIVSEMAKTNSDPFTGESLELSKSDIDLAKRLANLDVLSMSKEEAVKAIDAMSNFLVNQSLAGAESIVSKAEGNSAALKLADKGVKSRPLKLYFSRRIGRVMAEQFTSLPIALERMFGNSKARLIQKASGLSDVIRGYAIAKKESSRIIKSYTDKFSKKKPNGEVFNSSTNINERGLVSFMSRSIEGNEQAEFDRRKNLIKESINALKKGTEADVKRGENYQEVYDKLLKDSNNIAEVRSKADKTNLEAVDWWVNEWSKHYDDLRKTNLEVYNELLDKDLNYTPDIYKKIDLSESVDMNKSSFFNANNYLDKSKSGSLREATRPNSLPKNSRGEASRYISLDFDMNNANTIQSALTDINTASPIMRLEGFLNSTGLNSIVSSKEDRDFISKRIKNYVRNVKGSNFSDRSELDNVSKPLEILASLGVSKALGGITQSVKQSVPVAVNTIINSGRLGLASMFDPDIRAFIDNSGMPIANRGIASQASLDHINRLIEQVSDSKPKEALKKLEDLNRFYLKIFLQNADVFIARASFISYYKQGLKKQGINPKDIDFANHKPNRDALDFAQQQVDRQQNVSDEYLQGEFFTGKDPIRKIIRKVALPFANFAMNQKARMNSDIITLTSSSYSKQDKVVAARSLGGLAGEMVMFYAVSSMIRSLIWGMTSSALGYEESEEDKKKRMEYELKGIATNFVRDAVSPLPMIDAPVMVGANKVLNLIQGEPEEGEENFQLYEGEDRSFLDDWGVLGVALSKADNMLEKSDMAITGEYEKKWRTKYTKYELTDKGQKNMQLSAALSILYNIGALPSEFGTVSNNIEKIVKKKESNKKKK